MAMSAFVYACDRPFIMCILFLNPNTTQFGYTRGGPDGQPQYFDAITIQYYSRPLYALRPQSIMARRLCFTGLHVNGTRLRGGPTNRICRKATSRAQRFVSNFFLPLVPEQGRRCVAHRLRY